MKSLEKQIQFLDQELLPAYGFKSIKDYETSITVHDLEAIPDFLKIINQLLLKIIDVYPVKKFSLHKTEYRIKTLFQAFNLLIHCLEISSVPYLVRTEIHNSKTIKTLRLHQQKINVTNNIEEMSETSEMSETTNANLRKFDMSKIKDNAVILIIGKRAAGKSIVVLDYLYHHRDLPYGAIVSPTEDYQSEYSPHVPSELIHEKHTPEIMEDVLNRQKEIFHNCKTDPSYKNVDPRAYVIFDNCNISDELKKDTSLRWIFMNGRHAQITFIYTMQYCQILDHNLRDNVDYIFIYHEHKLSSKRRLYEQYAKMFGRFDIFNTVHDQCTKDYGCLVIDKTSSSNLLEDQVFWYKVDINQPDWDNFKLQKYDFPRRGFGGTEGSPN